MTELLPLEGLLLAKVGTSPDRVYASEIRRIAEEHDRTRDSTVEMARKAFDHLGNKAPYLAHQLGGLTEEQKMLYDDRFPEFQRRFSSPKGFIVVYSAWESSDEVNDVSTFLHGGKVLAEDVQVRNPDETELLSIGAYHTLTEPDRWKSCLAGPLWIYINFDVKESVLPEVTEKFPSVTVQMVEDLRRIHGAVPYNPEVVADAVKRFCF